MAIKSGTVVVLSTPTPLTLFPLAAANFGHSVLVTNNGTVPVFLGGADVSLTGHQLAVGQQITVDVEPGDQLYGLTSSTSGSVTLLVTTA